MTKQESIHMAFYEWHFKNHLPAFRANPTVGSIIFFNLSASTPVKLKIRPTEPPPREFIRPLLNFPRSI